MQHRTLNRWWTVLGGALCLSVGAGVISAFMFGTFIKAIATENGWGRWQVSLGLTAFEFAMGPGTIVLGALIDRLGVRRPTFLFLVLFAASLALVGCLPVSPVLFCAAFVLVGFFAPSTNALPYAKVVCAHFDQYRGLALGLTVGGTAVGAMLMPHYAGYLLTHYGWRGGYIGVAAVVAALSVPSLYFLVKMPPDAPHVARSRSRDPNLPSLWHVMRHDPTYRMLGIAIFCMSGVLLATLSQLVPMMIDRGETIHTAVAMMSVAGMSSAIGRLLVGYLMDRFHAPYIAAISFTMTLIGVVILACGAVGGWALLAAALIGVSMGAEADIVTFLVSRYFDMRLFGRVCGGMWAAWGWGAGITILLTSLCYDMLHSYHVALYAFVVMVAISVITIVRLGPYAFPEQRHPHRVAAAEQPA